MHVVSSLKTENMSLTVCTSIIELTEMTLSQFHDDSLDLLLARPRLSPSRQPEFRAVGEYTIPAPPNETVFPRHSRTELLNTTEISARETVSYLS